MEKRIVITGDFDDEERHILEEYSRLTGDAYENVNVNSYCRLLVTGGNPSPVRRVEAEYFGVPVVNMSWIKDEIAKIKHDDGVPCKPTNVKTEWFVGKYDKYNTLWPSDGPHGSEEAAKKAIKGIVGSFPLNRYAVCKVVYEESTEDRIFHELCDFFRLPQPAPSDDGVSYCIKRSDDLMKFLESRGLKLHE